MITLNRQYPKSAFQVTLFRLVMTETPAVSNPANNECNPTYSDDSLSLNVIDSLKYDFTQVCDSRFDYFWRNIYKYDIDKYKKFYTDNIQTLRNSISHSNFDLQYYDLTSYFLGYSLSMSLNSVAEAATMDLKESDFEIKENDMVIIEEVALTEEYQKADASQPSQKPPQGYKWTNYKKQNDTEDDWQLELIVDRASQIIFIGFVNTVFYNQQTVEKLGPT